ncbi:hypothetical protein EBR16_05670 [bacterium]|nr:hypothetical protein [bacterium]
MAKPAMTCPLNITESPTISGRGSDWSLTRAQAPSLIALGLTVWVYDDLLATPPTGARPAASPDDPAYVIYTSGSTGQPKGIVITHRNICHLVRSENAILGVDEEDLVYQGFSVAFDMSFEEIWISYLVGATLWIAPPELVGDPENLAAALKSNGVTVVHAVPTLMGLIDAPLPEVRLINLGGEACPDALVGRLARPGRRLFNTYGPTETSVTATMTALRTGEPVTIGHPLPNYGVLVVDAERRLADPLPGTCGRPGEDPRLPRGIGRDRGAPGQRTRRGGRGHHRPRGRGRGPDRGLRRPGARGDHRPGGLEALPCRETASLHGAGAGRDPVGTTPADFGQGRSQATATTPVELDVDGDFGRTAR